MQRAGASSSPDDGRVPAAGETRPRRSSLGLADRRSRGALGLEAFPDEPERTELEPVGTVRGRHAGVIQAVDERGLLRWAQEHDRMLLLPHAIGDFAPAGSPLVEVLGVTPLDGRTRVMRDDAGSIRIVARGRQWEDYLALAITEIREYGSEAIQVLRRLRAMLLELHDTVLPEHREAIEAELERLAVTVKHNFGRLGRLRPRSHARPTGHQRARGLDAAQAGAILDG